MRRLSLKISGFLGGLLALILIFFFLWPLPASLDLKDEKQPLQILDRHGMLLYELRDEHYGSQAYLKYQDIPENVVNVILGIEDRNFFYHPGVSPRGILRALWQNVVSGEIVSGGSSITQQLVRLQLQPEKRTYFYKLKEILLALKLEQRFTKEEILENYINRVYFGHQAYGIQAAAQTFFNKNVDELSLSEISFLGGLIQSPESYNPFYRRELAEKRHEVVYRILEHSGQFTASQLKEIQENKIRLSTGKMEIKAPHFVMWVADMIKQNEDFQNRDMRKIHTTLDLNLQTEAEEIIQRHLKTLKGKNVTSASAVVLDAKTGEILTMVGSADYFDQEHDGAVNVALASRQPGSALKPFTYALALKNGDTAATTVADIETQFFTQEGNPYLPRNYDFGYHGLVRYREALANSYNIAAVRVLEKVGVSSLMQFLKKAGVNTLHLPPEHYGLALTLGSGEVKLLELAQAYGMLARGGITLNITAFLDKPAPSGERILDEKIAWLISDILDDDQARLEEFGSGGPLEFDFPVAAKTGTTRNSRDNWTLGYTPEIVVGVWVGNADNSPMINTSGVTGAGPIFHELMIAAQKGRPLRPFKKPPGIFQHTICKLSGKLPTPICPAQMEEWFIAGSEPKEEDDIFKSIQMDRRNGLLASESCPKEETEEEVFAFFPAELQTWARENGWEIPPQHHSPLCPPTGNEPASKSGWLIIESPNPNESFLLDPLIPDEDEKIVFRATTHSDIQQIEWFVNGEKVCQSPAPAFRCEWTPEKGRFDIKAQAGEIEKKVTIFVSS